MYSHGNKTLGLAENKTIILATIEYIKKHKDFLETK